MRPEIGWISIVNVMVGVCEAGSVISSVNGTGVGVTGVGVKVGALLVCCTCVSATATVSVKSTELGVELAGCKMILVEVTALPFVGDRRGVGGLVGVNDVVTC